MDRQKANYKNNENNKFWTYHINFLIYVIYLKIAFNTSSSYCNITFVDFAITPIQNLNGYQSNRENRP